MMKLKKGSITGTGSTNKGAKQVTSVKRPPPTSPAGRGYDDVPRGIGAAPVRPGKGGKMRGC